MHRTGFWPALAAGVVLALVPRPASAASTKTFIALLNGGQETPPTTSDAFGVAFLTFDEKTKTLCYSITTRGVSSTEETAAHIHGPAAPGAIGTIVFTLVAGNPKNSCAGPFAAGTLRKALKKGQLYLNIHTNQNPNGEIRGQIIPTGR